MLERLRSVLMLYVSSITADSLTKAALRRAGRSEADVERTGLDDAVVTELVRGLAFFLPAEADQRECVAKLTALSASLGRAAPTAAIEIPVVDESGIVDARTQARSFAKDLGFDRADQAKIATSVSELARNMYAYGGPGRISLAALSVPRTGIRIIASDDGPGIPNIDQILTGNYRSKTGMGLGILACKRLMDEFTIQTAPGRGTTITLHKYRA